MSRGELVLVRCSFTKGGFPSEFVFHIPLPSEGELEGVAPRNYCFNLTKQRIKDQLKPGDKIEGYLVGLLLGPGESANTSRVNLPDNEIYDIPTDQLMQNGELAHVSLQS